MAEVEPDPDYAIFVRESTGVYELRIQELLLVVRGSNLEKAYEDLTKAKREVVQAARTLGMTRELPQPRRLVLFEALPARIIRSAPSKLHGS
jgi:hypothetical protein